MLLFFLRVLAYDKKSINFLILVYLGRNTKIQMALTSG